MLSNGSGYILAAQRSKASRLRQRLVSYYHASQEHI